MVHIIHTIHMIKYETFHKDLYACNVIDTTLHACGTSLDVEVMLPIDPPSIFFINTGLDHVCMNI